MALEKPNLTFISPLKHDIGKIIPWMTDNAGMYDILSSAYATMIRQLPSAGVFRIITEIYRPDLISYKIYGKVIYKVPLMLYNNIITPKDCYRDRILHYPSIMSLDNLLFSL